MSAEVTGPDWPGDGRTSRTLLRLVQFAVATKLIALLIVPATFVNGIEMSSVWEWAAS
jgi:hypothetical protein